MQESSEEKKQLEDQRQSQLTGIGFCDTFRI